MSLFDDEAMQELQLKLRADEEPKVLRFCPECERWLKDEDFEDYSSVYCRKCLAKINEEESEEE